MKKIVALTLAALMLFCLVSCGNYDTFDTVYTYFSYDRLKVMYIVK